MRLRLIPLLFVLCLGFSFGNIAKAISVGPGIVDVAVDAGKQTDFDFVVTNEEFQTLTFALTIQKFLPQGDSGQVKFLSADDTTGLPDWLFLEQPTLTLRAGESKKISVSFRVPSDATPGGHYAAIFLTQTSLDTEAGQNVSAIPRIGVLVFATVNGNVQERLGGPVVTVDPTMTSHLPVRFNVELENLGNIHVLPTVQIDITNVLGQTVATLDGNELRGRVMPGSNRVLTSEWRKNASEEDSGFWYELQQEWRNGGIGWYKANVRVSSRVGEAGTTSVSFQVWPWRSLIIGFVMLVTLFLGFSSMRRSRPRLYRRPLV